MSADRKTVVVTGASAGLGYCAAEQLARAGHHVVLAVRNAERGERARAAIERAVPTASTDLLLLDLADLDSVRDAAARLIARGPVDVVVNNAGVVGSSQYRTTAQGFELQMGTNHLGHFLWTALLLPAVEAQSGRFVHLGSIAHRAARLPAGDPLSADPYVSHRQYARSKLAVMLFGFELAERLADAGSPTISVVAHPGFSLDTLTPGRPGVTPARNEPAWARALAAVVAQGKDAGALPIVEAAVGSRVRSGEYWGPTGTFQVRGSAGVVPARPRAHDRTEAARLWAASVAATRASFAFSRPDVGGAS